MKIKVKYLDEICKLEKHGDWIDLKNQYDETIYTNKLKLISLGVCIKLPKHYEATMVMRSSSFKKYEVIQTNAVGIIDNAYCGEGDVWMIPLYKLKTNNEVVRITKGSRIAQFRINLNQDAPLLYKILHIFKKGKIKIIKVDNLGRNRGGFGSTGV